MKNIIVLIILILFCGCNSCVPVKKDKLPPLPEKFDLREPIKNF